jgi:hypothetical protein
LDEVRQIALDVFRSNFLDLRGIAEDVARARAEHITEEFLRKLEEKSPAGLAQGADPDFQRSLFNAQSEYACSGDKDLEEVLVDLLVDRADHAHQGLQTIVLNEAIKVVPKLNPGQRRTLALTFLLRHTRVTVPELSLDQFYTLWMRQIVAVGRDVPTDAISYQHIEYVGAGTVGIGSVSIGNALRQSAAGWFTKGFIEADVPENLHGYLSDSRIVKPCLRDPQRLQLTQMAQDPSARSEAFKEAIDESERDGVSALLDTGLMAEAEIREELVARVPDLQEVVEAWDNSNLSSLQLTSVGIAIGHGYWRRIMGVAAPLDVWIPN